MSELLAIPALWDHSLGYNTRMVLLGTSLLGLVGGLVGVLALLRKRSLTSDAASHATLPGVVLGYLVSEALAIERSLPLLLCGAGLSSLLGLFTVHAILRWTRLREDAAIGIVLSLFFAVGIVLLSYVQRAAPDGAAGLQHFIHGQTAAMNAKDAILLAVIAGIALMTTLALSKEFSLTAFDPLFARAQGWPVQALDGLLFCLVVLVTVAGLQAVGLLLVIAILIVPAVSARLWTERVGPLLVISGLFGAASAGAGTLWSAAAPDRPAGAVIVLSAGAVFLISFLCAPSRGVLAALVRRARLELRLATDHVLELAYERATSEVLAWELVAEVSRMRARSPLVRWILPFVLARQGYARSTAEGLMVSDAGRERGAEVRRNHALWEAYLLSHADIAPAEVDWMVDRVEHVLSADLILDLEQGIAARGGRVPQAGRGGA